MSTCSHCDYSSEFVVCECAWFKELSTRPGSCIEVVSEREQLEGFKVAVVKDWALNRTRYALIWHGVFQYSIIKLRLCTCVCILYVVHVHCIAYKYTHCLCMLVV